MSLADALASKAASHSQGPRCPIARALADLPPEDVQALEAALADHNKFTGAMIAAALTDQGFPMGDQAVQRHRRGYLNGGCRCGAG